MLLKAGDFRTTHTFNKIALHIAKCVLSSARLTTSSPVTWARSDIFDTETSNLI